MEKIKDLVLIIAAAGSSSRFGIQAKQLELLSGLPVFLHSVKNLSPLAKTTIIAVPKGKIQLYMEIAEEYGFKQEELLFVEGGDSRGASVKNALKKAQSIISEGIVAIHDAARPLAQPKMLLRLVDEARICGGAAPGKMVSDTLLKTDAENIITESVPRKGIWQIATPQVFRFRELLDAYAKLQEADFTDDTQVFMATGGKVRIIQEDDFNAKITYKCDLDVFRRLLRNQ